MWRWVILWVLASYLPTPLFAESLTLLITSDQHNWLSSSHLYPNRKPHGLLHLAPLIRAERKVDPELILLDGGDSVQGAPLAVYHNQSTALAAKNPFFRLLNELGYDAMTVGNHDLEENPIFEEVYLKESKFPWLAANAYRRGENAFEPYVMIERKGLKIAVLGLTTPGVHLWLGEEQLRGLEIRDLQREAKLWLERIRAKERPDLVIGLIHAGINPKRGDRDAKLKAMEPINPVWQLLKEQGGFDLVISGHDHRLLPYKTGQEVTYIGSTPVLSAGHHGKAMIRAKLVLDGRGGVNQVTAEVIPPKKNSRIPEEYVKWLDEGYFEFLNEALPFQVIGSKEEFALCLDRLQGLAVREGEGLEGSILPKVRPGSLRSLKKRNLQRRDLLEWFPYDNKLVSLAMSEREIELAMAEDPSYNRQLVLDLIEPLAESEGILGWIESFQRKRRMGLSQYHFYGGAGLGGELFLAQEDALKTSDKSIREMLFHWLKAGPKLPEECRAAMRRQD